MPTIKIETVLTADPDLVWDHVCQPQLLHYVAKGILVFKPVDPAGFPTRWANGRYKTRMYWHGWFPLGWQIIAIEVLPNEGNTRRLRDNGSGWLIRHWDHLIEVSPAPTGTCYRDIVSIEAGILTPFAVAFARRFYAHRQQLWHKLVADGFDYAEGSPT